MNAKKMYPISVEYVFKPDHHSENLSVKLIRDYCHMMNIKFSARKYDSVNIMEDKTLIEKLPALHIYIKNVHTKITYPDEDTLTSLIAIRNVYEVVDIEYMAYVSKKQIWNERLNSLKRMFVRTSSKTDLSQSKQT